ncbi:alpha/beta fold hydrolase [Erythrobacter sp. SDW2]|uniref:alpha/beta fold hydrolase n=1 Tax=Erythrobacter sp. SDW2 TaxID=2907154 RepID=UPI001F1F9A9B|nr:alpha/beta fold hydrolase [Erythrobacter sp. SDW2]UIP07758.1 alpha/beta fold hydrolase [Erythrobacter sp. SDW2]
MRETIFAAIILDRDGTGTNLDTVAADKAALQIEIDQAAEALRRDGGISILGAELIPTWDERGRVFHLPGGVLAPDWHQWTACASACGEPAGLFVRFTSQYWDRAVARVAHAFGLTELEQRLVRELIEFGKLDDASGRIGVGPTTSRNALVRLRQKCGARNVAELVSHVLTLMCQPHDKGGVAVDNVLADLLDLTPRQLAIVLSLADGNSRSRVAKDVGKSLSTVKALLGQVFDDFALGSTAELSSLVGQARLVLEHLASIDGQALQRLPVGIDRTLRQDDGRNVGYSMYGEGTGPVAAIMHSTISCRHPPSRFVRLMLEGGWRVVTIDRPGFGTTDSPATLDAERHFETAVSDLRSIISHHALGPVSLVGRGAGQITIAIAAALADLVDRVVLINPTPAVSFTPVDRGPLGAIKRRFTRNPTSMRALISLLLRLTSPERLRNSMRRAFAQSPPDLQGLDDPVMVNDYLRATSPLKANLDGYVIENVGWARGWEPCGGTFKHDCVALFGSAFVLHDPGHAQKYFSQKVRGLRCRTIRGAGQMLMYTHPEAVAAELMEQR